jgi:carboxylate-amine ligase
VEHNFGTSTYTLGVEEELMILDAETLDLVSAVESMLGEVPVGEVKPELMECVLEISTTPCATAAEAASQLSGLRREVAERAIAQGMRIAAAGTHPFARWENQRIVKRPRYRDLINALRFVARQELVFGLHVHVGIDDADKAIYVANGMREHVPVLVALSANSPFWRGDPTGLASTRMPIFRSFPRVGIPPVYRDWSDYERRIGAMVSSGLIEDYTYLWYDVRPHPNFGTIEVRAMDVQTRLEHTVAITALVQALASELGAAHDAGVQATDYAWEMLDENKWLAARYGLAAELVDPGSGERSTGAATTRRLLERLREHAEQLGSADELAHVRDLLDRGNGAQRQSVAYEANHDLYELVEEIVARTAETHPAI